MIRIQFSAFYVKQKLTNLSLKWSKVCCSSLVCVTSWTKASASSIGDKRHSCKHVFHKEVERYWESPIESPPELERPRPGHGFCMFDRDDEEDALVDEELWEDVFGR